MNQETLEESIAKFEQQFLAGNEPEIQQFASPFAPESFSLFIELLHTDLELKLRAGQDVRVESYLQQFPSLNDDDELISELLKTEFKVRCKYEPGLQLHEYERRFPRHHQSLPTHGFFNNSTVASTSSSETVIAEAPSDSCSDISSRFRKTRLHRQGGLGNIWLAIDREMDRTVAIKEIKSKFNQSESHRTRFTREQLITSKLDHPGIVPIYGVGHFADRTPYFAMQFIEGMTLTDAVQNFHQDNSLTSESSRLQFRHLLQHFIDACNTIDYAHSQNVVHRDIKPANIMIGRFGETFVVDWGLAKLGSKANQPDIDEGPNTTGALSTPPSVASDENNFSIAGQSIGSPGYMSPEQRAGSIGDMNSLSDVYGLGATLWTIITGSQPRSDENHGKTNTEISVAHQPLASMATKAMSKNPAKRYTSAKSLADDVYRYLSDDQVRAHAYTTKERIERFTRKHSEFIGAISIAGLLLTMTLAAFSLWVNQERQSAVAAKEAESSAREQAELARDDEASARFRAEQRTAQLTNTIQVFADVFAGTDDSGLALPLQQTTLEEALAKLQENIDQYDDPIKACLFAVFARSRKGQGEFSDSIQQYEQSIALLNKDNIPESDSFHTDVLLGVAFAHLYSGNAEQANLLRKKIGEIFQTKKEPPLLQTLKFEMLHSRLLLAENRVDEALTHVVSGLEIAKQLYEEKPFHNNLLWANYELASIHRRNKSEQLAIPIFEDIIRKLSKKSELHPLGISSQVQLAEMSYFSGEADSAIASIDSALTDATTIFGPQHPDTISIRSRLGTLLALQGDPEKRSRGIEELVACRVFQKKHSGLAHQNTMATTFLLAKILMSNGDQNSYKRAAEITSEYFDHEPPVINNAINSNEKIAVQIATLYAESMSKTDKLQLALDTIRYFDSKRGDAFFSKVIRQLQKTLEGEAK